MSLMPSGRPLARNRNGFALLLALGAIVVISALVAGGFMISTRDVRTARLAAQRESAQLRAENALFQLREQIQSQANRSELQFVGGSIVWNPSFGQGTAVLTRVSDVLYQVTSTASAGGGAVGDSARSRVSMLFVRNIPSMEFMGALTLRGGLQYGGHSLISGEDTDPAGWSCPDPQLPTKPGVVAPEADSLKDVGCKNKDGCITGDPKVLESSKAADDATYFQYGNTGWNDLKSVAKHVPGNGGAMYIAPRVNADGSCNESHVESWGDPERSGIGPCENYFPIIYVNGDAKINQLKGQGVLLVEGDLEVQGSYEFYGPIIVKGRLKTTGTGGHFTGGVMAANVDLDQNVVLGDAVISYSNCAIMTALRNSAALAPVRQRGWADLY